MKKFFLTALLAVQGLFATEGHAQQTTRWDSNKFDRDLTDGKIAVVFDGISYRLGDNRNYYNPGIGLEYRLRDHFHIGAGVFRTSSTSSCLYAVAGFETNAKKPVGLGTEFGITTFPGAPLAVVPYLRFGSREAPLNVKINVIPPTPTTPFILGGQLRWRLLGR